MRRPFIEDCGGIDEQFHYAFDWDLYIRYLHHFPLVREIDELLVHFRLHDQSKTQSLSERFHIEERKIIQKLSIMPGYEGLYKTCRYKIQKEGWTEFLSSQSKKPISFLRKLAALIAQLPVYHDVSYSRQTLGAIKAFWEGREI